MTWNWLLPFPGLRLRRAIEGCLRWSGGGRRRAGLFIGQARRFRHDGALWRHGLGAWARGRARSLQSLDRLVEGQALRAQHAGCRATAVTHNRGQHDRAIDLAAAALLCGGRRVLENAHEVFPRHGVGTRLSWRRAILNTREIRCDIRVESTEVDVTGMQDEGRVGVGGNREQQVLQRNCAVRLSLCVLERARQRHRQIARFRNPAQRIGERLRHPSSPHGLFLDRDEP